MTKTITVELEDYEYQALSTEMKSVEEWAQYALSERARWAADKIISDNTSKYFDESIQIPTTKAEVISDCFSRDWVKTSEEVETEMLEQQEALFTQEGG